jgi:antitoxin MazE
MELQVSRWGNSLAMRLPSDVARRLGLREGDQVQARVGADGALSIRPATWSRKRFAAELAAARDVLPESPAVLPELRQSARY